MKRPCVAAVLLLGALLACNRDESSSEKQGPIESGRLPTPSRQVQVADAIGQATPVSAHPTAPPAATVTTAPAAKASPAATAAPVSAPAVSAARAGTVGKGVDIREAPSADAEILGTFQGRTKVEVLEEQGGFARVKAPTTGGGAVEGWVLSSTVSAPGEKPAAVAKASPAKPATSTAAVKTAAPSSAKPAAAAPAKTSAGGNGPDDILLKAISGMTMKRAAVPFTHKKHHADYAVKCADCHHAVKARGGAVPATHTCTDAGCHQADQCNGQSVPAKNKACPYFEDAYHFNCIECHRAQSGPTKCAECHSG